MTSEEMIGSLIPRRKPDDGWRAHVACRRLLRIGAAGMTLNATPVLDLEALGSQLHDRFAVRADRTLFVKAAGTIPYGRVIEAMDVACGAGAERIGIVTD